MGLMTGSGPFGRAPAGTFNFEVPVPVRALYLEPTPKRIRVVVGEETVADSRRAMLLHESGHQPIYYFPPSDVRADRLEPSHRHTRCPLKGEASYYTIRAGERVVDAGAWYYPDPLPQAPPIQDLIAFYWDRMDGWFEEDEEIFGHPRDPYHRVDVRRSDRHVRISLHGELLAESTRASALFESNLPTRWYLPREHVLASLQPSDTRSYCPYKGQASYHSVVLDDGETAEDLIWTYADPLPDAAPIKDLLCFFNERADVELDGELQERPESPWSHGIKSRAQNASPAQTRG
jgi:uncharacterized protein (DUF427 family)